MSITKKDYEKILTFYKIKIPKSYKSLKNKAENILSNKLCKCIKGVGKTLVKSNEPRAIGICTKTIFNNKGYTRSDFSCNTKKFFKFKKTIKNINRNRK